MTKRSAIALRLLVKILLNFVIDIPSYMGHILLIMSQYHVKMQDGIFFCDLSFLNLARSTSYTFETYPISSP